MPKNKKAHNLAKLLAYALGRRPDEFGLLPDMDGYFKIKEVLKAVCEEDGFGYVRRAHLDEILLTIPDPGFEIDANRIRASASVSRPPEEATELPKLLFTCVRRRAYSHVLEYGITPGSHDQVVLSSSKSLAERIGRRSDASPILLTVQVTQARSHGIAFQSAGSNLFLASEIPPPCFRGPALPKEIEKKPAEPPKPERQPPVSPGSYTIDIGASSGTASKQTGKKDRPGSKRNKPKRERPPWRR